MAETMQPERFPLYWPEGQARTRSRARSQFQVTQGRATLDLLRELKLFNAHGAVISTNVELRNDGLPRAGQAEPKDPGVAVYFTKLVKAGAPRAPFVIACDTYLKVHENIRAVGKTIECLRGIERYGAQQLADRAFTGFMALPPRPTERPWHELLGVPKDAPNDVLRARWHELSRLYHPDLGGDNDTFAVLSEAWARASRERGI